MEGGGCVKVITFDLLLKIYLNDKTSEFFKVSSRLELEKHFSTPSWEQVVNILHFIRFTLAFFMLFFFTFKRSKTEFFFFLKHDNSVNFVTNETEKKKYCSIFMVSVNSNKSAKTN